MSKKKYSIIGIVVGVLVILVGILAMAGALGGEVNTASSSPYLYDSGYATFGGDFYTYVSNNAAEAASASRTVAYNLYAIAELLKNVCGVFLMAFGLLMVCLFGCKLAEAKTEAASSSAVPVDAPCTAEPVDDLPEL